VQISELDAATRALYLSIVERPDNRALKQTIEDADSVSAAHAGLSPLVALVPGIFYQDYPHTGADGAVLRQVSESLRLPFAVIPVDGTEGLDHAATRIVEWLDSEADAHPILLFSLSKGSAEVRQALIRPDAARAFRNVIAWVSVSGLPFGTPSFEAYLRNPLRRAFVSTLFRLKGWRLDRVRDLLRHRPDAACPVPATLPLVQIIAFPDHRDLRDRRSRWLHRQLAPLGPNDGFTVIADLADLPGRIYPMRQTDHYLRRVNDLPARIERLIAALIEEATAEPSTTHEGHQT
jgi:hypothetical protein